MSPVSTKLGMNSMHTSEVRMAILSSIQFTSHEILYGHRPFKGILFLIILLCHMKQ